MPETINIVVAVDVIAALSRRTLDGSLHMMDDGPMPGRNQGTAHLVTWCWPGWQINWTIQQIDLQTPAVIRDIRFDSGAPAEPPWRASDDPASPLVWSGIVPPGLVPGVEYRYAIDIEMGRGVHSILTVDTASVAVPLPREGEGAQ
jgi:hypothetical protein